MQRVLMKIDVQYLYTFHLLLKHYIRNYRWICNLLIGIKKAELCPL